MGLVVSTNLNKTFIISSNFEFKMFFRYHEILARHRYFNSTKSTTYKANGTRIELTEDADPLSRNLIGVIAEDIVEVINNTCI